MCWSVVLKTSFLPLFPLKVPLTLLMSENVLIKSFFAFCALNSVGVRCFYLFSSRFCERLFKKHKEIKENCDFLFLIDNQTHCISPRRRIEAYTGPLHSYDKLHKTPYARVVQADL